MRFFVLKVATPGLHLPCSERNAITKPNLPQYGTELRAPRSDAEPFFNFINIWQQDAAKKKQQNVKAPRYVNLAQAMTWLIGVVIYYTIFT